MSLCITGLNIPDKKEGYVRVVSIDPSPTNMGVTFFDINITKQEPFNVIYMNTLFGDKLLFDIPDQFDDTEQTGVNARGYGLARSLSELIEAFEPDVGICEDNFLGLDPSAFKRLIQFVGLVVGVFTNNKVHLTYVSPRPAKAIVNADFKGSRKEDVKEGLINYNHINWGNINPELADEHSCDSGVIGLYLCEKISRGYNTLPEYSLNGKRGT